MFWHVWMSLQIVLEMLPISSSGHLTLIEKFAQRVIKIPLVFPLRDASKIEYFFNAIQFPTLLVLAVYFFKQWFFLLRHMVRCRFIIMKIITLVFIADGMTCLWYLIIKQYQWFTISLPIGFLITALVLASSYWSAKKTHSCTMVDALILGCIQGIALLPGISRLATTLVGARWLGIPSRRAFEISWLLQAPLLGAAFLESIIFHHEIFIWQEVFSRASIACIIFSSIIAFGVLHLVYTLWNRNTVFYFSGYMMVPFVISILI